MTKSKPEYNENSFDSVISDVRRQLDTIVKGQEEQKATESARYLETNSQMEDMNRRIQNIDSRLDKFAQEKTSKRDVIEIIKENTTNDKVRKFDGVISFIGVFIGAIITSVATSYAVSLVMGKNK